MRALEALGAMTSTKDTNSAVGIPANFTNINFWYSGKFLQQEMKSIEYRMRAYLSTAFFNRKRAVEEKKKTPSPALQSCRRYVCDITTTVDKSEFPSSIVPLR